jgi:hypothetical protein
VREHAGNNVRSVIYPNPNNGVFNIMIGTISENMSVEVYNIIGELVSTQVITGNVTPVNMSQMTNGIYLVKIKEGAEVLEVTRVIKQ